MSAIRSSRIIVFAVSAILFASCNSKNQEAGIYPSGNASKDYFYRRGYSFPFYCDSMKPICRLSDTTRYPGKLHHIRAGLAAGACTIIQQHFNTDSLLKTGDEAFSVVPVMVYYVDSPVVWYRVVFREYKNNTSHETRTTTTWQLLDSNRVLSLYHNLEFLVNEDGSLELKCDQI